MQIANFATFSVIEAQGYLQGKRKPGMAAGRIRIAAEAKLPLIMELNVKEI